MPLIFPGTWLKWEILLISRRRDNEHILSKLSLAYDYITEPAPSQKEVGGVKVRLKITKKEETSTLTIIRIMTRFGLNFIIKGMELCSK